jgi:hypothetical protein
MPVKLAKTPANCAGNSSPAGVTKNKSQANKPKTMAKIAPCVVALDQYSPNNKGTNAPTNVTW